jgi:biotin synthase
MLIMFQDKTMMARWGLEGMRSFAQDSVAKKEGSKLEIESEDGISAGDSRSPGV